MRWFLRCTFAALAAAVVVTACSSFEATPASEPADAGRTDAVAADAESSDAAPAALDDGSASDAGAPCTATCRSRYCDDDGGCHPFVFVTEEQFNGRLDNDAGGPGPGIDRADYLCNAIAGDGGTRFVALASVSGAEALTRITAGDGAHRPVRRHDGAIVAASYFDLFTRDGGSALEAAIDQTQNGALVAEREHVWTGTDPTGRTANTCSGWTDGFVANLDGTYGLVGATDGTWVEAPALDFCGAENHLYCFELVP